MGLPAGSTSLCQVLIWIHASCVPSLCIDRSISSKQTNLYGSRIKHLGSVPLDIGSCASWQEIFLLASRKGLMVPLMSVCIACFAFLSTRRCHAWCLPMKSVCFTRSNRHLCIAHPVFLTTRRYWIQRLRLSSVRMIHSYGESVCHRSVLANHYLKRYPLLSSVLVTQPKQWVRNELGHAISRVCHPQLEGCIQIALGRKGVCMCNQFVSCLCIP